MSNLKGWFGEKLTTFGMWLFVDGKTFRRFHDIIVPSSTGTTQVDHLLISRFGLFVIETKNMDGWIFGSEKQPKWTQTYKGRKFQFQNPLRQNYRHIKCLAEFLQVDESIFHSVIFFIGEECTFKTKLPSNVLNMGLQAYIESFQKVLISEPELERIYKAIEQIKNDPSLTHDAHLQSLAERHNSTAACPKCGGKLVKRTARKGPNAGSEFLGCGKYPKCRFTKPIPNG